jgi:hypothetical protein
LLETTVPVKFLRMPLVFILSPLNDSVGL